MADIRINALPTTATDFASDDYIAIDGTTNGTRKLNAKTANLTFSDVTLGSSGPSVKSSLSARAPRQGLVFDGTAGATFGGVTFGSSDFTVTAWISVNSLSANNVIIDTSVGGIPNAFALYVATDGSIRRLNRSTSTTASTAAGVISVGKTYLVTYVRGAFYVNGVLQNTFSDTSNYSTLIDRIGWAASSDSFCTGFLSIFIYNRALSASEVVALYESGAPAGADYNSASNTSLVTGDNSTFASDTGFWTKTGTATIGSGVASLGTTGDSIYRNFTTSFRVGTKARATFTVGGAGSIKISNGTTADYTSGYTAGTYTVDFTIVQGSPADQSRIAFISIGSATLDNVTIFPLGLLLAPDAAQAGGGLVWYDTSGNAANITLPASGVSWNVPSSRVLGGNWTTSGNLTVSGLGDFQKSLTNIATESDYALRVKTAANDGGLYFGANSGISVIQAIAPGSTFERKLSIQPNGGNVLIGTAADGGQKLQVSGTSNFSNPGSSTIANFTNSANADFQIVLTASTSAKIGPSTPTSLILQTNGTTALTLDSSQNATFAGSVRSSQLTLVGNRLEEYSTNADTSIAINYVGYNTGTTRFRDLQIYDGKASLVASFAGSTKQLTLYGPLQLANAYQAGAPTATGYVTIKDSNGTTYKVLVST